VTSRAPAEPPSGPPPPEKDHLENRAIILAVERDPHVRELEAFFLNEAGFEVVFAADGEEALSLVRRMRPDIIISEILVPKLDGLALCRTIKSDVDLRHCTVLILSILAARTRALEAGADAFLMKPLAERRLVDTVRELLAKRAPSQGQEERTT
jgi:DNA-binding response OmpR family regulator